MTARLIDIYLDKEFLDHKSVHKFPLLWASGIYKLVNRNMRNSTPQTMFDNLPHTFFFVKSMIEYCSNYGVTKEELMRIKDTLYRGISTNYINEYHKGAFISTSFDKNVAKHFAKQGVADGLVMTFETSKLPNDIKYVYINHTMGPYLLEEEVLFLPGRVDLKNDRARYYSDPDFLNEFKSRPFPMIGGGYAIYDVRYINQMDLRNKKILFYRAIYNRPVEILGELKCPPTKKECLEFVRNRVREVERKFDQMTEFIPEYQDLTKNKIDDMETFRKFDSFHVHMALVNPKTKTVETINFLEPLQLFSETKTDDVITRIETALNNYFDRV